MAASLASLCLAGIAAVGWARWGYVWVLNAGGARELWPGHAPVYATPDSALFAAR